MRGADTFTESLFTMRHLDDLVPASHPLRPIRTTANAALVKMDALLSSMYEADIKGGRPSLAPEKLLRAMLLQIFYSVRSERPLMCHFQKTTAPLIRSRLHYIRQSKSGPAQYELSLPA